MYGKIITNRLCIYKIWEYISVSTDVTLIFKYNKISTMEEKYLSTFHNMDENDIQIIANQMKVISSRVLLNIATPPSLL